MRRRLFIKRHLRNYHANFQAAYHPQQGGKRQRDDHGQGGRGLIAAAGQGDAGSGGTATQCCSGVVHGPDKSLLGRSLAAQRAVP